MNKGRRLVATALAVLLGESVSAEDIGPVVEKTCAKRGDRVVGLDRLALFTLFEAGIGPDDLAADPGIPTDLPLGSKAIWAVRAGSVTSATDDSNQKLLRIRQSLEHALASTSRQAPDGVGLQVANPGRGNGWLFDEAKGWQLTCRGKPPEGVVAAFETPEHRNLVSVRKNAADLGLTGDAAKKADAATLGFQRERDPQDDGDYKRTTKITIDAAIGLKVSPDEWTAPVYLYGNYTVERDRTKPAPKLDPGKKQRDDDTDVLELGAAVSGLLLGSGNGLAWVGEGQAGYDVDYVAHAKRARVRLGLIPGWPGSLGICDFGGLQDHVIGAQKFRTRCLFKAEAEMSHIFRAGTADFHDHGNFLALGGTGEYDVVAPLGDDRTMLASLSYRYLPTVAGHAPDVKRWDASIKWRFYPTDKLGLDVGLTWGKGTEPKALAKEDKLALTLGVIY